MSYTELKPALNEVKNASYAFSFLLSLSIFAIGCMIFRPPDDLSRIPTSPEYRIAIEDTERTVKLYKYFVQDSYPIAAPGKSYWILIEKEQTDIPGTLSKFRHRWPFLVVWPRRDGKDLFHTSELLRRNFATNHPVWVISAKPLILAIRPEKFSGKPEISINLETGEIHGPVQLVPRDQENEKTIGTVLLPGEWWKMSHEDIKRSAILTNGDGNLSEIFSRFQSAKGSN